MNSAVSEAALIGIDWGTTSFRAFLLDRTGHVLDHRESGEGIVHVPNGDFAGVLVARLDGFGRADLPIVASGMITSRNGWVETPYASLPAGAGELAAALVRRKLPDRRTVWFVPGLTTENAGIPDVMRGEETQIVGAKALGAGNGVFVLPGTHSKWSLVRAARVAAYATYMTGEIYAALRTHTILGKLMRDAGEFRPQGFRRGVEETAASGSELLHTLFSVRTLPLFDMIAQEDVSDYLSGLLIGAELRAARSRFGPFESVTILGRSDLQVRYSAALHHLGIAPKTMPDDIAARGHYEIAKAGGLLR